MSSYTYIITLSKGGLGSAQESVTHIGHVDINADDVADWLTHKMSVAAHGVVAIAEQQGIVKP